MNKLGKALLIVGPAGSGKSTLAHYVADKLGWKRIEEDAYWVKNNWGSGMRTDAQESVVQSEVSQDIIKLCQSGKNTVLEFILYKNPPNPLTNYSDLLESSGIECIIVALKPSLEEILNRQLNRGRSSDVDNMAEKREHAEHQIKCLEEDYIKHWSIDTTHLSVEETFDLISSRLL